jgi:acetyltransferase
MTKPIIVIKAGQRGGESRRRVAQLTGSDDVLDAAFCRAVRVTDISDVFHLADVLGNNRVPPARLAIITNAGGPAVLATDADRRRAAGRAR